jgi:hypothetical protein
MEIANEHFGDMYVKHSMYADRSKSYLQISLRNINLVPIITNLKTVQNLRLYLTILMEKILITFFSKGL